MPKTVLITGCSTGIGHATALELARRGYQVHATVRRPETVRVILDEAENEGVEITVHLVDVRDGSSVSRAVDVIRDRSGRIDVLINNAASIVIGPVDAFSDKDLADQFDSNVFGVVRMVRAVVPIMRRQGSGLIINLSSVSAIAAPPLAGIYAATKYAVEAISEALRVELRRDGIDVAVIEPGVFSTAMVRNERVASGFTDEHPLCSKYAELCALRDASVFGNPIEVATVIAETIEDPKRPFRQLVGEDAKLYAAKRAMLGLDAFQRSAFSNWAI